MRNFLSQLSRFGIVGFIGLVVDVGLFNLLRATILAPETLHEGPVLAKIISTSVAILANWIGNRYWTFRTTRRVRMLREGLEFVVVSVGGMMISLGCLWFSHYALGFQSALADNLSANGFGLVLGTAFRFWLYRIWVFNHPPRVPESLATTESESARPEAVSR